MNNHEVNKEFARRKRTHPLWRTFKAKWDGKSPRKGSSAYKQMCDDTREVEKVLQALYDEIKSSARRCALCGGSLACNGCCRSCDRPE